MDVSKNIKITYKQKSVLLCIENFFKVNHKMPSGTQIAKSTGIHVKEVWRALDRAETLGLITREYGVPGSIKLCYEGSILDHSNVTHKDR